MVRDDENEVNVGVEHQLACCVLVDHSPSVDEIRLMAAHGDGLLNGSLQSDDTRQYQASRFTAKVLFDKTPIGGRGIAGTCSGLLTRRSVR